MKKLTTMILTTSILLGCISCKKDQVGEGPAKTETRFVQNFTTIDLQMNGNVYFTESPTVKLEVTAKESIHDLLETTVVENRLVIRYKNGKTYDADESIRITISAPDVNSFMLNTSGSIYCMNDIHQLSVVLRSYGSGSIHLKGICTSNIDAENSRAGSINATEGSTISAVFRNYGSGRIDLSHVSRRSVTTRTEGSGDIRLKASDNLDVTIDGSGSVYYGGYPALRSHISGTGRLIHL